MALTRDKLLLAVGGNPAIRLFDTVAATRTTGEGGGAVNATASIPPLQVLEGHTGNVIALGFHTEGRWLWSASEDGTIRIWDTTTSEYICQREINLSCPITSAILSPSQVELYVADQLGKLRVWDLASNTSLLEVALTELVAIHCVSISSDGRYLACVDHSGKLHLWQICPTTGNDEFYLHPLCTVQAHGTFAIKCVFSPDATSILTTSADGTGRLWKIVDSLPEALISELPLGETQTTLELMQTLVGHSKWIWDCAFSADSAYMVTVSSDNTARLWDVTTSETIAVYSGHSKAITSVVLNDLPSTL